MLNAEYCLLTCLLTAAGEVVEQMMMEGEKTKRKLQKVQQRRDHYARLYYQTIMELDVTRLALDRARKEISDLQTQGIVQAKPGPE